MNNEQQQREDTIEFEMNYCQHYAHGKGSEMVCEAGQPIKEIQNIPAGPKQIKWGPCIGGHHLENPTQHCPCWIRRTREMGEARADGVEKAMKRMTLVMPVVSAWRKKKPIGKQEVIECPVCKGKLHLRQSSYNGHVHGKCETENCVNWME